MWPWDACWLSFEILSALSVLGVLGVLRVWRVLGVWGLANVKLGRPEEAIDVALGCLLAANAW